MINKQYSRYAPGKYALVLDFETTGADFGGDSSISYQAISMGAVIADTETWEEVDSLYCLMKFDDTKYKWTEGAEKIHGISQQMLQEEGLSREDALAQLLELLLRYFTPTAKILLVGHNVEFDRSFLSQLLRDCGVPDIITLHHVLVDTSGLGFVLTGEYKSDIVFDILGMMDKRGLHNALDDARACLASIRNAKQIFSVGLQSLTQQV